MQLKQNEWCVETKCKEDVTLVSFELIF
uniref:Uncharacterized protein n=1 Tax=Arundo donax TaxID=35708 RepID=A0A0A9ERD7_ARUDO